MLRKIVNPQSGKEEYINTGGGAAGQTASDFHATGKYGYFSMHSSSIACIKCGKKISEKRVKYCIVEQYPFVCSSCHLDFRKQNRDLRKYCLYAECSICNREYFYTKNDLAKIFKVGEEEIDKSFLYQNCYKISKCICTLLMNDYINKIKIIHEGRSSYSIIPASIMKHWTKNKGGYNGRKPPRRIEKIKVKSKKKFRG